MDQLSGSDKQAPGNAYLQKLGEFAYWVSYLEWDILGDIRLVEAGVKVDRLLSMSTGNIGRVLGDAAPGLVKHSELHHFLTTSSRALMDVARRRNGILHARPATGSDGQARLLRLRSAASGGMSENFWIDEAHLEEQISAVHYWLQRLQSARSERK